VGGSPLPRAPVCPTQEAKQPLVGAAPPTVDAQMGSRSGERSSRRSVGLLGGTFRARRARPSARRSSRRSF
jgi:hypothetical protein